MQLRMGNREFEWGGKYLGQLRESTDLLADPATLRARLLEEGYVFVRGLHRPDLVQAARQALVDRLDQLGQLDHAYPLDEAVLAPGASSHFLGEDPAVLHAPGLRGLVEGPEVYDFFSRFFGGPVRTYDYKWPRATGAAEGGGSHYDAVHFNQGSLNVVTMWIPLGHIAVNQAPLAVLEGSHRWEQVKATYGQAVPERDNLHGAFTSDAQEVIDHFGGRWLTTAYQPGDALIFGLYTMHAGLANQTNRYRMSCDIRWQRADEVIDPRWVGEKPIGQNVANPLMTFEEKRKEWGL